MQNIHRVFPCRKMKTFLFARRKKLLLARPYSGEYCICFPAQAVYGRSFNLCIDNLSYWLQSRHRQSVFLTCFNPWVNNLCSATFIFQLSHSPCFKSSISYLSCCSQSFLLTNFEINMTGEFLLFKKNTAIKTYSVRGLKEVKGLSENVYKFVKKITYVKYYFKQIHNPEASKCTKKLTTSRVFYA